LVNQRNHHLLQRTVRFVISLTVCCWCCRPAAPQQPASTQQTAPTQQPVTPQDLSTSIAAGKRNFERHCALCHGIDGSGGRGPNLHRAHLLHAPDDKALNGVISEGIPPEMPAAWFLSGEEVASVAAYVRSLSALPSEPLPGNAGRGAAVFAKAACERCHMLGARGFGYGPALTDIGERRSPAHIRGAILKPDASLPDGFLFVKAVTASGVAVEGIRLNEDTFSIQIKDANGHFYSVRKSELRDLQKLRGKSPMPSYSQILTAAELDDLVAYLAAQRGPQ
jgi:cytochrome c oxidase cbb3-type subunit III